ncbi:hypothetical protein QCA50_015135 [Cerrena zonata]|uniref:Uncharacterized protein n=1 Tax=Cerrena zonata TaxID=2478898 RepID=A0AAW0FJA1_9APHY
MSTLKSHNHSPASSGSGFAPLGDPHRPENANSSSNGAASSTASPRDFGQFWIPAQAGSPLSRAGLLQPKSYMSSPSSRGSRPRNAPLHTQEDIRDYTMQLSSLPMQTPAFLAAPAPSEDAFIFPSVSHAMESDEIDHQHIPSSMSMTSVLTNPSDVVDLTASTSTLSTQTGPSTPRLRPSVPSGLSLMLSRTPEDHVGSSGTVPDDSQTSTPTVTGRDFISQFPQPPPLPSTHIPASTLPRPDEETSHISSERQPLLSDIEAVRPAYGGNNHVSSGPIGPSKPTHVTALNKLKTRLLSKDYKATSEYVLASLVKSIPAVVLGTLLNILDGISYGMIIFPTGGVFANMGGVGVSMFFVSAVIAQLTYSFGGSGFAGANGSMMIEVVPFFHILANTIAAEIGEDNPHAILATTIVAFSFSSILTGLTFFLLGALRLGSLIGFFPRHILVGCIGGVGVFLIITGFTVCTRMSDDDFDLSLTTFKFLFLDAYNLALWLPPFALAVILRIITHKYHHQLIFPLYFIIIPIIFYIVVVAASLNLSSLRDKGWLFIIDTSDDPWYKFYSYYDFRATSWSALWATLPTQLALLFFNILHPPLNVPALAVSLNHDIDTDKELVGHGYSNLLAGIFGTVPNYLVYVNTLLFYRVGGTTRISGFILAGATAALLFIGTGPIEFIPVMVVGALIFVLGIDLVKEALWDTRHRVNRLEYITIASIMVCMTVWDFVIGVLFGIIMSCFFFVIQSSQRRSIRALYTGETAMSTIRRPGAHRAYLREVSKQTTILRLQGFLFFGTITQVEETIRGLVDGPRWQREPMRFLILDIALVPGVDMSAAEAFVRVQRLLNGKQIILVISGLELDSPIEHALASVGLLVMDGVEVFSTYSDALEWTENSYLRAWFMSQKVETNAVALPGRQSEAVAFEGSLSSTPRRSHIVDAGLRTIARDQSPDLSFSDNPEPCNTLVMAFSSYAPVNRDTFLPLVPYLDRMHLPEGHILWEQGEPPDGLYIVESGILRATYRFAEYLSPTHETMVPGTLAGELSTLSGQERNARCVVERQATVWKLTSQNLSRLENEQPEFSRTFMKLVLKAAKLDYDTLIAALALRQ